MNNTIIKTLDKKAFTPPPRLKPTNSKAFTLAEVLTTLMVIGVVAALTIPSMMQSHKERVTVTKVKQAHSILNQAFKMAENEHGDFESWTIDGRKTISNLKPYLKIQKDCTGKTEEICAPTNYISLQGPDVTKNWFCTHNGDFNARNTCMGNIFVLNNGMIIASNNYNKETKSDAIFVDIDGIKGKNQHGVDLFSFSLKKNGIHPYEKYESAVTPHGYKTSYWIIHKGNMNYLREDVDWGNLGF